MGTVVVDDSTFASARLAFSVTVTRKLETENTTLHESFSTIDETKEKIRSIRPGSRALCLSRFYNKIIPTLLRAAAEPCAL